MALVIETGANVSGAEAFANAADYAAWYLNNYGTASTDTTANVEAAIRRAVRWLEGQNWTGLKTNGRSQALQWPRSYVVDRDGFGINSDEIPPELIDAQHVLTKAELTNPGCLAPEVTLRDQKVLTQLDVMGWTPLASAASTQAARTQVLAAMDKLKDFVLPRGTMVRA